MRMKLSNEAVVATTVLAAMAILPVVSTVLHEPFYIGLGTRVLIFGIAAISVDLILGFGGMISLGHAAYIGIGAYSVGILSFYGIHDGFVHFAVAILASALIALPIGASSVRTTGIHFIMISLAFGQMLYYLAISISAYGGDDGLTINTPSDFGSWLTLKDPITLYYFCFVILVLVLVVLRRMVGSRFGLILQGIKLNDPRARSIGISSFRYKLVGYVVSAMVCGLAGALLANQNLFISPASMQWNRSGEILIMAILGGMGTLYGGLVGAFLYVTLEFFLSQATAHWQAIFGPIIVVFVLFAGKGLWGVLVQSKPLKG
jgi:branched-chain amino acid transport system permease protein